MCTLVTYPGQSIMQCSRIILYPVTNKVKAFNRAP